MTADPEHGIDFETIKLAGSSDETALSKIVNTAATEKNHRASIVS